MDRLRVILLPNAAAEDLKAHSPYLSDLNIWYRERAPRGGHCYACLRRERLDARGRGG